MEMGTKFRGESSFGKRQMPAKVGIGLMQSKARVPIKRDRGLGGPAARRRTQWYLDGALDLEIGEIQGLRRGSANQWRICGADGWTA
jgi:hypothetical protein